MQYAYLSDSVKTKKISDDGEKGTFHVEGLFPGYGLTVGNSLRRALLSSLPGAAITQFKVKGVLHEFSTIPGVLEDVVEISINLKKLRFEFNAEESQVLTIKVKGEKEVTGADIESNAQVKVVNPEVKLFTITDKKTEVEMEITVEKGLGYVSVERRKAGKLEIGVVALDAIFTPVINVAINVDNMRVGERTDYNRLILDIQTDGSVTPSEALHKASNILVDHFTKIGDLSENAADTEEKSTEKEEGVENEE